MLCQVSAHIQIEGNKEVDNSAKQAIDILGITTTKLPYTDDYFIITPSSKESRKIVIADHTISNNTL